MRSWRRWRQDGVLGDVHPTTIPRAGRVYGYQKMAEAISAGSTRAH
jgi:hypothetical protein